MRHGISTSYLADIEADRTTTLTAAAVNLTLAGRLL